VKLSSRVEIVKFQNWPDRTGYFQVQVAIGGKLSWPFDIHESDWGQMNEGQRHAYLERSAMTLIGRYGDARHTRVREDGQIVARSGEAEI
jgi:hypothetical protein